MFSKYNTSQSDTRFIVNSWKSPRNLKTPLSSYTAHLGIISNDGGSRIKDKSSKMDVGIINGALAQTVLSFSDGGRSSNIQWSEEKRLNRLDMGGNDISFILFLLDAYVSAPKEQWIAMEIAEHE